MVKYVVNKWGTIETFDEARKVHSFNDKPSTIKPDGTLYWHKHGIMHRDWDRPAIITSNGSQHWYQRGNAYRDGGLPASIYNDGTMRWYEFGTLIKERVTKGQR